MWFSVVVLVASTIFFPPSLSRYIARDVVTSASAAAISRQKVAFVFA